MGRRAGRGRGREEGRVAKGGGSPGKGRGSARALPRARAPAASPAGERGAWLEGRGREHAPCALLGALRLSAGFVEWALAGWLEGGREGTRRAGLRLPAFHLRS